MARSRKFAPGMRIRGVELVKPTHLIAGRRTHCGWIVRHLEGGELSIIRTAELFRRDTYRKSAFSTKLTRSFHQYRYRARRRGQIWRLTRDQFYILTQETCHYCKAKPANGRLPFLYNGLDRKDNSLGYTIKNVVSCCAKCNGIKSNLLTYEEMLVAMRAVVQNRK